MISGIHPKTMNTTNKKKALVYLIFIKEKQDRIIKEQGCAYGKERVWCTKEETSTPTVIIESVFLMSSMNAKENHNMETVYIPGAFLQVQLKDNPTIRLDQQLVG